MKDSVGVNVGEEVMGDSVGVNVGRSVGHGMHVSPSAV